MNDRSAIAAAQQSFDDTASAQGTNVSHDQTPSSAIRHTNQHKRTTRAASHQTVLGLTTHGPDRSSHSRTPERQIDICTTAKNCREDGAAFACRGFRKSLVESSIRGMSKWSAESSSTDVRSSLSSFLTLKRSKYANVTPAGLLHDRHKRHVDETQPRKLLWFCLRAATLRTRPVAVMQGGSRDMVA